MAKRKISLLQVVQNPDQVMVSTAAKCGQFMILPGGLIDVRKRAYGRKIFGKRLRHIDSDCFAFTDHFFQFIGGAEGDVFAGIDNCNSGTDLLHFFHIV